MQVTRSPMMTVAAPGPQIGPPTCGLGPSDIGQVRISVIRAARGMVTPR